ncbi:unnamed protein product [Oppiella nova]|uniref:Uncharacterized protein n=1 Tax=Oppiella nova TaxID=334625 RepID=A0A7R9L8D5_9ACAR|nr:unnamed protein product [Oppiella nova]CAG2158972.1 unnamed protein product [Oppiella nova]
MLTGEPVPVTKRVGDQKKLDHQPCFLKSYKWSLRLSVLKHQCNGWQIMLQGDLSWGLLVLLF